MNNKTVIIDNYDSFTYNLVHTVEQVLKREIKVVMNDEIDFDQLKTYDKIILSPGPGIPENAGMLNKVISELGPSKHILGVCLGQQAMGEVYGAKLKNLNSVFHGVRTLMTQTEKRGILFNGIEDQFYAGRYHSWVIDKNSDLSSFDINVLDSEGEIMAIQHKRFDLFGVQFHPESIMTDDGYTMIENFINYSPSK